MSTGLNTTKNINNKLNEVTYHIAVDPGFDAFKVVVNGTYFSVPREIVKGAPVDQVALAPKHDDFLCHQANSETHYMGSFATVLSSYNCVDKKNEDNISIKYFSLPEFTIGLEIVIAYAIYSYNTEVLHYDYDLSTNEIDLNISKIYLALALPHSYCDQLSKEITGKQARNHEFALLVGQNLTKLNVSFSLQKENIICISQTIAVLMGRMINQDISEVEKKLPTLIIDGGYLTIGIVSVFPQFIINENIDESNVIYTMNEINRTLADEFSKNSNRNDVHDYTIDNFIETEPVIRYIDSTGKVALYDLKNRKEELKVQTANKLIEYLNKKFNHLLSYKSVHIAGGTGIIFSDQLRKEYVEKTEVLKNEDIILVQGSNYNIKNDNHFLDKKNHTISLGYMSEDNYSATFGIAIGAYRSLTVHFTD